MPQELIAIFLLFVAALAFGWFYLQRAKARTTPTAPSSEAAADTSDEQSAS